MICPIDGNELTGKQKYCSGACRVKASRSVTPKQSVTAKNVTVEPNVTASVTHKHWVGKEPHVPILTECTRKDCTGSTEEPNWVPSCTEPCCGMSSGCGHTDGIDTCDRSYCPNFKGTKYDTMFTGRNA